MSVYSVQEREYSIGIPMKFLSDDFRGVVERIQIELAGDEFGAVDAKHLATVDEAERAVDNLALELRRGTGNRRDWRGALEDYESAWLEIIRNARDSDN